jgi:N-acetylglucosaminyldiphosphoundecaprenol N-acetyl-beta-D-mannosaminyltransferase
MPLETEDVVGYPVYCGPMAEIVNCVTDWVRTDDKNCRYFACLNPHSAEVAVGDPVFHNALICADFLTADGVGIVLASRVLGGKIRTRITGTDVFLSVNEFLDREQGASCFFLGSTEQTLEQIRQKMAEDYPNITVAGSYSPPFKPEFTDEDNQQMLDAINRCSPDVLWVGMTAPKQEKWLRQHQGQLQVNFAGPIGAVFDFYVGNVERAGPVWQKLGLEWLPRLIQEPRRLWRRVFVSGPGFLLRTLRYRLKREKTSPEKY